MTKIIHPALKYAFLSIPATMLMIFTSYNDPVNMPKLLILIGLSFVSVVLYLLLFKSTPKKVSSLKSKTFLVLYILLAIAMLTSGFLGSQNYIRIMFGTFGRNNGLLYYLSALMISLIILKLFISQKEIEYFYQILKWTSLPLTFYGTLQFLELDPVNWSNPYSTVIGTLGNPNFSSSAFAIFSIFWLFLFSQSGQKNLFVKSGTLSLSILMSFLSWKTGSLQGLLVILVGYALVSYVVIRKLKSNRFIPYVFFGVTSLALAISFASFLGLGPLGSQLEQYTLKLRFFYASVGLRAMIDSPWTGTGVDSYIHAFRANRGDDFVSQYGAGLSNNNAHSTPAQIGATFGVIVFVLYCLIHLIILYRCLQLLNSRSGNLASQKGLAIVWMLTFFQSLLSIEVIGLGIVNWVLGALILSESSSDIESVVKTRVEYKNKIDLRAYPAWTGAASIVLVLIGSLPFAIVTREEYAFRNLARLTITDQVSKAYAASEFSKLTEYSLLSAEQVDKIVGTLYRADLVPAVGRITERLYQKSPNDAFAGDLLATYYLNTNQLDRELMIRIRLRELDPWNYWLELALAKALARAGKYSELEESIAIIKRVAPDSTEYIEAKALLDGVTGKKS